MSNLSFLLDGAPSSSAVQSFTASQALQSVRRAPKFLSRCPELDNLFLSNASEAPGLPGNCILELAGTPGTGKSRVALSYAVEARLAADPCEVLIIGQSRLAATVHDLMLFVDTEGAFDAHEVRQAVIARSGPDAGESGLPFKCTCHSSTNRAIGL